MDPPRLFVSYAQADRHRVAGLIGLLDGRGYAVWWDREIQGGRFFSDEIEKALAESDAIIVIWSSASIRSHWVRDEAASGRDRGCLIPLLIDRVEPPLGFRQIQCIEISSLPDLGQGESDALLRAIESALPRSQGWVTKHAATPATLAPTGIPSANAAGTIAILPFADLSAARDQAYFCEGIAEEITVVLARLPGLRVTAASTAFLARSRAVDHRELGGLLKVGTYLEGSVRRVAERVKISARLVESATGFIVWSEVLDRESADLFAVQEEIARAVVGALNVVLAKDDEAILHRRGTQDARAYDYYMRARLLMRRELEDEYRTAAELFREATVLDPSFALAWAGVADALAQLAKLEPDHANTLAARALEASQRAIATGPELPESHIAHGNALRLLGHQAAADAFAEALRLNPRLPELHYHWARFLVSNGEKKAAIEHYEQAFALAPDDYRFIVMALQEYQAIGDVDGERSCLARSWSAIEHHLKIDPTDVRAYTHGAGVLALLGRKAEARRFVDRALAFRPNDYSTLYTLACAAMLDDDAEQALDLLERAISGGRGDPDWMVEDNDLAPLRDHPRFLALIARMREARGNQTA